MITVNGHLQPYCEGCPYLELTENEIFRLLGNHKEYCCEHENLCARLYRYLSERTTTTTTDN